MTREKSEITQALYEMQVVALQTTEISASGRNVSKPTLEFFIPDEAEERADTILSVYGQSAFWYFGMLGGGRPPPAWAYICLDRQYDLAEHIWATRPSIKEISYTPYAPNPKTPPPDFISPVGCIQIHIKSALERVSPTSPLWAACWGLLKQADGSSHWIGFLGPLDEWANALRPENQPLHGE